LTGKSCSDEFAFSIDGVNVHYGVPLNPQFPDRVPGGSSSGSASAVASKQVDFAIGTDTAGSVRTPASFCGIYGFRPTHGRVSLDGVLPLAHDFDTVGWFARDAQLLKSVGNVLLKPQSIGDTKFRLLIADDAFALTDDIVRSTHRRMLDKLKERFPVEHIQLEDLGWKSYFDYFRTIQGWQAWQFYGDWMEKTKPSMDKPIKDRFEFSKQVSVEQYQEACHHRKQIIEHFDRILTPGTILCMPTTWNLPPLINSTPEQFQENRVKTLQISCVAPLAGIPQVTMPIPLADNDNETKTIGFSLLAHAKGDLELLDLCEQFDADLA
jgi:amidase